MRFLMQLVCIMKKDLLLMRRNKSQTFLEILIPFIYLMPVFILFNPKESEWGADMYFQSMPIYGNSTDLHRHASNIPSIGVLGNVAYFSNDEVGHSLIDAVGNAYGNDVTFSRFDDFEAMISSIQSHYGQDSHVAAIYLQTVKSDPTQLQYTFYLPEERGHTYFSEKLNSSLQNFWLNGLPDSISKDVEKTFPINPDYYFSGYLSLQFSLEKMFLEKIMTKPVDHMDVVLQRMPALSKGKADFMLKYGSNMPSLWPTVIFVSLVMLVKNIVTEKEDGIKTYMLTMGLEPMAFYSSHLIFGFLKTGLILSFASVGFTIHLQHISTSLIILLSWLFALNAVLLAILISAILRKASVANVVLTCALIGLTKLASYSRPDLSSIRACFEVSLNFSAAFSFGINTLIKAAMTGKTIGWLSIFSDFTHFFTVGFAILMLVLDALLLSFAIYYVDAVLPTDGSPKKSPLFIFKRLFPSISKSNYQTLVEENDENQASSDNFESTACEADLDIQHMSKIWESGTLAVDKLSFRAHRGRITVLLGQNGAGKSTTFSAITGVTSISSGRILVCGADINIQPEIGRMNVGYCPQYNPLFPKLSVREHLQFYASLKNYAVDKELLEAEITSLAQQLRFFDKLATQAGELSGGTKRKLCVAIALIGQSRVILLDEPTAGMDPEARQAVATLLSTVKKDRTVLLTTHYMEEADKLGDQIGIMANGRLVCNGSSEFLKGKFGTGYILSFDVTIDGTNFEEQIRKILLVVQTFAINARLDKVQAPAFAINVPFDYKRRMADMFEALEKRKSELHINSFGLSENSLEQAFLRVGELADPTNNNDESQQLNYFTANFFHAKQHKISLALWVGQFSALFYRHFLGALRGWTNTISPFLMFLFFIYAMSSTQPGQKVITGTRELSLSSMESSTVPVQGSPSGSPFQNRVQTILSRIPNIQQLSISPDAALQPTILEHILDTPPPAIGVAFEQHNQTRAKDTVHALFNGVALHSQPLVLSLISNAVLGERPDSIKGTVAAYNDGSTEKPIFNFDEVTGFFGVGVVIISLAYLASSFCTPIINEKNSKFKHQLMLTKMSKSVYWTSLVAWNGVFYLVFCSVVFAFFALYGILTKAILAPVVMLLVAYFWSITPIVFCCSCIFKSASFASNVLFITLGVTGFVLKITISMSGAYYPRLHDLLDPVMSTILPTYSLCSPLFTLFLMKSAWTWPQISAALLSMAFSTVVYSTIFVMLQSQRVAMAWHKLWQKPTIATTNVIQEQEDVAKERSLVEERGAQDLALAVSRLSKNYGDLCAVNNLTFGVKPTECFGLLGINGAGKTTTFDIISGQSLASHGSVMIGGVDVQQAPSIGYCPQVDALALELTGRETLRLLSALNGIRDVGTYVDQVLQVIHMANMADKLVKSYSGGQKRRLSIGVTLVCEATLIMLDEPTAGIDPKTRRAIWQLLLAVRQQGVAILLTSHSMEECEALCDKIGFMHKGCLISVGTSQHLKNKYGGSFLFSFTLANPSPAVHSMINSIVVEEFEAKPTQDSAMMSVVHWEIPRQDGLTWSKLFRRAQAIADRFPVEERLHQDGNNQIAQIKDFSVTQNSLEQVFHRLSTLNDDV